MDHMSHNLIWAHLSYISIFCSILASCKEIRQRKNSNQIKILNKIVLGITCGNLKEMFNPVDFYNNFG